MSADQDNHWDELAADLTGKPIANKKTEDSNAEKCDANVEETTLDAAQEDANSELEQDAEGAGKDTASDSVYGDESENQAADDTTYNDVVNEPEDTDTVSDAGPDQDVDEVDEEADGETSAE
ncbi:MAG: hypothetical protein ACON5G_08150, partial [Pirellulaceae bacterium]